MSMWLSHIHTDSQSSLMLCKQYLGAYFGSSSWSQMTGNYMWSPFKGIDVFQRARPPMIVPNGVLPLRLLLSDLSILLCGELFNCH